MEKVTLEMILAEMKRIEIAHREQIQALDLKLTGRIQALDLKLTGRLDQLQSTVEVTIAKQTADNISRLDDHERRITKLEGPNA